MLAYQFVLIAATLICAASAGLIYAQAPERRAAKLLALVLLLGSGWAGSELAVSMAPTEADAFFWMRWGALGWVPLGALLPVLVYCSLEDSVPHLLKPYRRVMLGVAGFEAMWSVAMAWTAILGGGFVQDLIRTDWGWTFTPRPVLSANYAVVTLGILFTSWVITRVSRRSTSETESLQIPWVWLAILAPSVVVSRRTS